MDAIKLLHVLSVGQVPPTSVGILSRCHDAVKRLRSAPRPLLVVLHDLLYHRYTDDAQLCCILLPDVPTTSAQVYASFFHIACRQEACLFVHFQQSGGGVTIQTDFHTPLK